MQTMRDFLSPQAGQKRRAWLEDTLNEGMRYFLGPTGIDQRIAAAGVLNPINDIEQAGQNAQRVAQGDMGAIVPMVTDMATVLAPVAGARLAGGDATAAVVDSLLGMGGPTRQGLDDAARRFAADESGALTLGRADPAADRGAEVMQMLRSGRASEVTDEMLDLGDPVLNARLNDYLFRNYDLPMDEASRMQRAGEMGFDTGTPLYHGTGADFQAFEPSVRGKIGPGVYLTPEVELAEVFSAGDGAVLPVVATNNPAPDDIRSLASAARRDAGMGEAGSAAFARELSGYDGLSVYDQRTILDPRNIRSRFARFDPRLAHLRNLSAATIPLGVSLGLQQEDEEELRAYLGL